MKSQGIWIWILSGNPGLVGVGYDRGRVWKGWGMVGVK